MFLAMQEWIDCCSKTGAIHYGLADVSTFHQASLLTLISAATVDMTMVRHGWCDNSEYRVHTMVQPKLDNIMSHNISMVNI